MALTPKIKVKLTANQRWISDSLETCIDRYIETYFDGKEDSVVKVDISDFRRSYAVNDDNFPKIMDEISRKYNEAGWNVNYTYRNENDKIPNFVELSPKK